MTEDNTIYLCDYAVAFVDLLGQKAEMPDRHLPENKDEVTEIVKRSFGRIVSMQQMFHNFYKAYTSVDGIYSLFPNDLQNQLPDMAPGELKIQKFSDGFVIYVPLGKGVTKSTVNSIFGLLMAVGSLCMIGLAGKAPVRIGVDAAWAVEYMPNELYGAAIAYSYQLESEVAQWPRVVIGEGLTNYLKFYKQNEGTDLSSQYRVKMSELCLNMLSSDTDGQTILHYLGNNFRDASKYSFEENVQVAAKNYVDSQYQHWQEENNTKLTERYAKLKNYFNHYAKI